MTKNLQDFFDDEEFVNLQVFLKFLEFLIQYHDPELHIFLKSIDLTPELFATPWFLTVFCSKMTLDMVYCLWDLYLFENNRINMLFISLALLEKNRKEVFDRDISNLPQFFTSLTFKNIEDIEEIFKKAKEIKAKTPLSFQYYIEEICLKNKKNRNIEEIFNRLDELGCLAIKPLEIMHNLYGEGLKCQRNCQFCFKKQRYISYEIKAIFKEIPHLSRFFKDYEENHEKHKKFVNFLIIDLRTDRTTGFLNKSQLVKENQSSQEITMNFNEMKEKYHFVLLGNDNLEGSLGKQEKNENILRKNEFLRSFLKEKFKFVSILEEGSFEEIHDFHKKFRFEIMNHFAEKCKICKKNETMKNNNNNPFMELFNHFFKKNKEEKVRIVETLEDESIEKQNNSIKSINTQEKNDKSEINEEIEEKFKNLDNDNNSEKISDFQVFANIDENQENHLTNKKSISQTSIHIQRNSIKNKKYCENWLINVNDNKHCYKDSLTKTIFFYNGKEFGEHIKYSYN